MKAKENTCEIRISPDDAQMLMKVLKAHIRLLDTLGIQERLPSQGGETFRLHVERCESLIGRCAEAIGANKGQTEGGSSG